MPVDDGYRTCICNKLKVLWRGSNADLLRKGLLGFVGQAENDRHVSPTFAELNEPWFSREVQVVLGSNFFKR